MHPNFKFVGSGIWWNDTDNVSVMLNEDYKRTFRAYAWHRPDFRHVFTNKNGNPIRFRSAEAAAEYAMKHKHRDEYHCEFCNAPKQPNAATCGQFDCNAAHDRLMEANKEIYG